MSNAAKTHPRQQRSTSFPVLPLPEAVRILREVSKYGFEHTTPALATHMGHSTHNSGSFRERIAALKDWGLITRRGDLYIMTDTARMITMPTDRDAERQSMRQAFHSCRVFSSLYEQTAKERSLARDGLKAQAVHEFTVTTARAEKFVDSFIKSAVYAELANLDNQGQVILRDQNDEDAEDSERAPKAPSPEPTATTMHRAEPVLQTPTIQQSWPIDGGEIVLTIHKDGALPAASFQTIGEIVGRLEALATSLKVTDGDQEIES